VDASHTSHTRAQTGIQRVCRSLVAELEGDGKAVAVCFDPHLDSWRRLNASEAASLRDCSAAQSGASRGARWTVLQKLSGRARRLAGRRPSLPASGGLICPELFSAQVGARLPGLIASVGGPSVAVFHDAIGLKFPELTPPATVARLPAYLRELLLFDGIAAVSDDSAASLRDYWHWLGIANPPPVQTIAHGVDDLPALPGGEPAGTRVLCVGTIEGRKNHLALLEAADALWREGVEFELELIGMARAETAAGALRRIESLQRAGRPLLYHGSASEARLQAAYARCAFTVYPSLMEGFGLPVLESLRHGKPCVCSGDGALGESARGGGCLPVSPPDAAGIARAMRRLLQDPIELSRLAAAARARKFRTWRECSRELVEWMGTLVRRR
jgi:glycosyltransferase involved in cell wall biosynthesis